MPNKVNIHKRIKTATYSKTQEHNKPIKFIHPQKIADSSNVIFKWRYITSINSKCKIC